MASASVPVPNPRAARRTRILIWIFTSFVVLLTWAAPIQRYRFERREAIQAVDAENRNRAIMLEQYVTRTLLAADIATLHIAERLWDGERLNAGTPDRPVELTGPIAKNPTFLGLSVVDAQGNIVASTLGARVRRSNVADHEAFQVHLGRKVDGLYVSRPAFSRAFNEPVIWLTRRLERSDGRLGAVVAVNISPRQLIGLASGVEVGPLDVMSVIGLDGITRARRTGNRISAGEDLQGTLVMRRQRAEPNGSYVGASALDGLVRHFSHRRLTNYPLFATYGVPEEQVMEPVARRARLFAFVAFLVTMIAIAFALILNRLLRQQQRTTLEIASVNRRLEEAQQVARIGDWSMDLSTMKIIWSPTLCDMYERAPGDAPSLDEYLLYLDEEGQLTVNRAIEDVRQSLSQKSYELDVTLPGDKVRHHLINCIPRLSENGEVVGLYGTDQDVTAQRRLDRLESEVAHLSRVEAMNAMAATLAHELNQPLTAASNYLVGTSRFIGQPAAEPGKVAEGVKLALAQVHFAGEIIRRVRAMVSNEPKRVGAARPERMIDEAMALATAGGAKGRLRIHKEVARGTPAVLADPIQIQQVLLNLVRNAVEATEPGTVCRLKVCAALNPTRDFVLFTVEDDGPGFGDAGPGLFSSFASSKESGLGLGLSISRTIVESHGGRIWLDNVEGGGARVSFTLAAA